MTDKGPVEGDRPEYRKVADFDSIPGVLVALGVDGRPKAAQREAVRSAWAIPSLKPLLRRIEPELRRQGLL